jgi:hypothetical protein
VAAGGAAGRLFAREFGKGRMTRYPEVRVKTRTQNPLLLVAVVRQEMRRAGLEWDEIEAFSEAALNAGDEHGIRRVCGEWVDTRRTD